MNILPKSATSGYGLLVEDDAGYISPSDNKQFINEVKESVEQRKFNLNSPKLYGVMQKYGVKNRNGRIYPESILKREVEKYNELIEMGASAGETDHPSDAVISIKNTSLRISKLWWEGRNLMGEIYLPITRGYIESGIISHPADKIAHDIIHGFQYGVSSRGVGSLEKINGDNIVQDDFELICWDFVTTPSTKGSWIFPKLDSAKPYMESKHTEKKITDQDIFGKRKKTMEDILKGFNYSF